MVLGAMFFKAIPAVRKIIKMKYNFLSHMQCFYQLVLVRLLSYDSTVIFIFSTKLVSRFTWWRNNILTLIHRSITLQVDLDFRDGVQWSYRTETSPHEERNGSLKVQSRNTERPDPSSVQDWKRFREKRTKYPMYHIIWMTLSLAGFAWRKLGFP
jgi:hypothetical protein